MWNTDYREIIHRNIKLIHSEQQLRLVTNLQHRVVINLLTDKTTLAQQYYIIYNIRIRPVSKRRRWLKTVIRTCDVLAIQLFLRLAIM